MEIAGSKYNPLMGSVNTFPYYCNECYHSTVWKVVSSEIKSKPSERANWGDEYLVDNQPFLL